MNPKAMLRGMLPRLQRPWRIRSGPLRGLKIVTSWHDYPAAILGYTERKLTDWLMANANPGETWLDIGANCGYTSLALCQAVGPGGRVYAFEPALTTTACLERTGRVNGLDQLITVPFALSESSRMTVSRFATACGMIDSQLATDRGAETAAIFGVGLDTLWDGIAPEDPIIHGLKMDIQGMELDALRGMEQTLARYRPKIVLEIHRGVSRDAVLNLLEGCGYLLDPDPIDDTLGEFSDPESNASFVFLPPPNRREFLDDAATDRKVGPGRSCPPADSSSKMRGTADGAASIAGSLPGRGVLG